MKYVFCPHDYGDVETSYPFGESPCGQNFWVRRETLEDGRRFHDNLGPRPGKYFVMCDDGYFLLQLEVDGYKPIYVPSAAVGHQVQPYLLNKVEAVQRAYRYGGSWPYLRGLSRYRLLEKHPMMWRILRLCSIFKDAVRYCFTRIPLPGERRMERQATAFACLANNIESLRGINFIDQRRTFSSIAETPEELAIVRNWGIVPK
jgi:hypothetical protein